MRRALTVIALGVVIALAALWWTGGFDRLAQWAAAHQRAFQNSIALSLRAVRAGQPEAVTALLSACFAYGLVHAAATALARWLDQRTLTSTCQPHSYP